MPYRLTRPAGFYPPLLWQAPDEKYPVVETGFKIRAVIAFNLLLRFLIYPFNFTFNAIVTAVILIVAIVLNIGCIFGGYFNDYWSHKTKKLNEMAVIRLQWLIVDSFAFLWNQAKLFLGLFKPSYAIQMLNTLSQFIEDLNQLSITNLLEWIIPHQKRLLLSLKDTPQGVISSKLVFCAIAAEPIECLVSGINMIGGFRDDSHAYGLNPQVLTDEQARYPALILIHGNYANQRVWFPLARAFQKLKYPGPVYTVNLPAGEVTEEDFSILKKKMLEINAGYEKKGVLNVPIHLVGHSRGVVFLLQPEHFIPPNFKVDKRIEIGNNSTVGNESYSIIKARFDMAIHYEEPRGPSNLTLDSTGHNGLVSHPETILHCYQFLSSRYDDQTKHGVPDESNIFCQTQP